MIFDLKRQMLLKSGSSLPAIILAAVFLSGLFLFSHAGNACAADGYWTDDAYVATAFDSTSGSGGSAGDPYLIASEGQLAYLAKTVNSGNDYSGKYFKLIDDLDLSAHEWVPIGAGGVFSGNFDGDHHVISGLNFNDSACDGIGLFGFTSGGSISNVGLNHVVIIGRNDTGALVGACCSPVSSCYATGTVTGAGCIGGLVGCCMSGSISNSWTDVTVVGTDEAIGGLLGYSSDGTVTRCYATGQVTGQTSTGGLIGHTLGNVSDSYAAGSVSGNTNTGGFVGKIENLITVNHCYATGNVSGNDYLGGFIGDITFYNRTVKNCFCTGAVTPGGSTTYVGGFAGHLGADSSAVLNCYYVDNTYGTSGIGTIDAGNGGCTCIQQSDPLFYSTAVNYTNGLYWDVWDMSTVWEIADGASYPTLLDMPVAGGGGDSGGSWVAGYPKVIVTDSANGKELEFQLKSTVSGTYYFSLFSGSDNSYSCEQLAAMYDMSNPIPIPTSLSGGSGTITGNDDVPYGGGSSGSIFSGGTFQLLACIKDESGNFHPSTPTSYVFTIEGIALVAGEATGSMKVNIGSTTSTNYVLNITDSEIADPGEGSDPPIIGTYLKNPYLSGTELTGTDGVAIDNYVQVYVLDNMGKVSKFYQQKIIADNIKQIFTPILAEGSLGTAGYETITGLTSGTKYQVSVDGATKYVKADGTLSDNEADVAGLTGTQITGLTNGKTYKVELYTPTVVSLATGSLGTAGNQKITGLTSGTKYQVIVGEATKYVKADGTLSDNEADAAGLTGTEITGLTNGTTYKVEAYSATTVTLATGSLGTAGNQKITGLTSGTKYQVIVDGATKYVKADGTLSANEADAAGLTGTEITGLTNGTTYKVEEVPQSDFDVGLGTQASPYEVATAAQLNKVRDHLECYFIQTADIDLNVTPFNTGEGWAPIGSSSSSIFTGSYDGNGHKIANLMINEPEGNFDSLFGYVKEGTIKNLGLTDVNVTGSQYVGALVGFLYQSSAISNCYVTGSVTGNDNDYVGGMVGNSLGSTIEESYSTCTVGGGRKEVGGLVGHAVSSTIQNCYATGSVSGAEIVGGLVGYNYSSNVLYSYSTGMVTTTTNPGGLLGGTSSLGTIRYSFWDTQTSGQETSGGGTGKTTAEMKTLSTFTEWDFAGETANGNNDYWALDAGKNNGYPVLVGVGVGVGSGGSSTVTLATGSLGTAGDQKITGLTSGAKYQVIVDGATKYVKADGTLSNNEADAADLTGTEITGLVNGTSYKVEAYAATTVTLATGSLGTAGDQKITGLTSGSKYQVIVDGATKYVKADGTLSANEADLAELTGTEITGLVNGTSYKVEAYAATTVTLATGSLGTAGDQKITGLTSGSKYQVIVDGATKYVKADGTLSANEADLAALTGTEITGLTNGITYKVELYYQLTIGGEQTGGAGRMRTITIPGADADNMNGKYLVAQFTQGSGETAQVSIVTIPAAASVQLSYRIAGTRIDVWLASGMPDLVGSDYGVSIYTSASTED